MKFIVVDNKDYLTDNFKTFTDKTRLIIARQIADNPSDLRLLLKDNHFLIRSLVLYHFDKLSQAEIKQLLCDKSARVRLQTLYKLKIRDEFFEIIYNFIADNSASVREFARYSLKERVKDFTQLYNENLLAHRDVFGSLIGLAETSGKQFSETIEKFLSDKKIKIRKAAFLALTKLDTQKAYEFALLNLDSKFTGIRNLMANFLSNSATPEVLEKARKIYDSHVYELKKSMLKLFSKIGKWTTIADIMLGTIDENENIRSLSFGYLQQWRNKASDYYTQPKPGELERANRIFNFAYEVHEEKKYFSQNPLTGIDFYLR